MGDAVMSRLQCGDVGRRAAFRPAFLSVVAIVAMISAELPSDLLEAAAADPEAAAETTIDSPSLRQAIVLREAGKFDDALEELRAGVRDVKQTQGEEHPDLLPLYDLAAEILFQTNQMEKAEPLLDKVVILRERLIERGNLAERGPLAASLLLIGKVHSSRGEMEDVIDSIKRAVLLYGRTYGPMHADTMRANDELAKAVGLFDETLGAEHEAAIHARESLADIQEALGRYSAAAVSRQELYDVKCSVFGDGGREALIEAQRFASASSLAGQADAGIGLLSQAVSRALDGEGASGRALGEALRSLALLQLASDRFSAAAATLKEASEIDERWLPDPQHPCGLLDRLLLIRIAVRRGESLASAADDVKGIVQDLSKVDAFDEDTAFAAIEASLVAAEIATDLRLLETAQRAAEQALELADGLVLDPNDVTLEMVKSQAALVRVRLARGDAAETRELAEETLGRMEQFTGPASWATLDMMITLAEGAVAQQDFAAAEKFLDYLIEWSVPRPDYAAEQRLASVVAVVSTAAADDGTQAELPGDLTDRFIRLREQQFGKESPEAAQAEICLANAFQSRLQWKDAIRHYEEAIDLQKRILAPHHPEIAAGLLPLSRAYRAINRQEDAQDVLIEALAIWEESVGPEHPVTLETVKSLALSRLSMGQTAEAIPLMERLRDAYISDPQSDGEEVSRLLVRLARLYEKNGDRASAGECLNQVVDWGWWQMDEGSHSQEEISAAAVVMADVAAVFQLLNESAAARSAERTARSLAALLEDSQPVEQLIDEKLTER